MAQAYVNSFIRATTVTSQTITGLPFSPTVLMFWGSNRNDNNVFGTANLQQFFGFAASTVGYGMCSFSRNGAGGSETNRRLNLFPVQMLTNSNATFDYSAVLSSIGATSFTLMYSSNTSTLSVINYMAIGGSDITVLQTTTFTISSALTSVSVTGLSATADLLIVLHLNAAGTAFLDDEAQLSLGVANGSTHQWALTNTSEEARDTGDTWSLISSTAVVVALDTVNGSVGYSATLQSTNATSFNLEIKDAAAGTRRVSYIAINGGVWDVSTFVKVSTAAPATNNITGLSFTANGVFFAYNSQPSMSTSASHNNLCVGATDTSNYVASFGFDQDNATTMQCRTWNSSSYILGYGATAGITQTAKFSTVTATSFSIVWDVNSSDPNVVAYLAVGTTAATGTDVITTEDFTMSELFVTLKDLVSAETFTMAED